MMNFRARYVGQFVICVAVLVLFAIYIHFGGQIN